jgi:hypothetical protein
MQSLGGHLRNEGPGHGMQNGVVLYHVAKWIYVPLDVQNWETVLICFCHDGAEAILKCFVEGIIA